MQVLGIEELGGMISGATHVARYHSHCTGHAQMCEACWRPGCSAGGRLGTQGRSPRTNSHATCHPARGIYVGCLRPGWYKWLSTATAMVMSGWARRQTRERGGMNLEWIGCISQKCRSHSTRSCPVGVKRQSGDGEQNSRRSRDVFCSLCIHRWLSKLRLVERKFGTDMEACDVRYRGGRTQCP
jgi:hypothetical protein